MMLDEGSLASGAAHLLEARGERELAALVGRSSVELAGRADRWSMGAREVLAYRVALVVSAEDHARLSNKPEKLAAVKDAFAAAIRTPETELEGLVLVLALPPSGVGFHHAYRDAPARPPEPPAAEAVLGGAARLCAASGDKVAAEVLSRASLEDTFAEGAARPLRRFVLRLDAADLARAQKDAALADRLARAVRDAAATAAEMTTAVHLGVRLESAAAAPPGGPEALLTRALESKGVAVVPVERGEERTVLALVMSGGVALVEIGSSGRKVRRGEATVARHIVPARLIDGAAAADVLSGELVRELLPGAVRL